VALTMSDSLQPVGQASSLPVQGRLEACPTADLTERLAALRARTPARILAGRAGASYRTTTHLQLRQDHAAARDAVEAELDLTRDLGEDLVRRFGLFEVRTRAAGKGQYLMRPDLGRQLCDEARQTVTEHCPAFSCLDVVIGQHSSPARRASDLPPRPGLG